MCIELPSKLKPLSIKAGPGHDPSQGHDPGRSSLWRAVVTANQISLAGIDPAVFQRRARPESAAGLAEEKGWRADKVRSHTVAWTWGLGAAVGRRSKVAYRRHAAAAGA